MSSTEVEWKRGGPKVRFSGQGQFDRFESHIATIGAYDVMIQREGDPGDEVWAWYITSLDDLDRPPVAIAEAWGYVSEGDVEAAKAVAESMAREFSGRVQGAS